MSDDAGALEELRKWPEDVSSELWKSRRELFGDPDLGASDASGEGAAQYAAGIEAMRNGDTEAAGMAFTEAASLGHSGALREIGEAIFYSLPMGLNLAAAEVFERGAEGGDTRSQCWLGMFCRIHSNLSGALVHYRAADGMGDPEGSRELGLLLEETGDRTGARTALERARDRGSASGALALAYFLKNHTPDLDGAERASRIASDMGHPKGAVNLVDLLQRRGETEQALRFRRVALENARQHRALMEFLEGPEFFARIERIANKSASSAPTAPSTAGAASAGSCVVLVVAIVSVACIRVHAAWRVSCRPSRGRSHG